MKCMEMKDVLQEVFLLPRGMKTSLAFSGLGMDHFVISSSLEEGGSKLVEYKKKLLSTTLMVNLIQQTFCPMTMI